MKHVTNVNQAFSNISNLAKELEISRQLAERLGLVHTWYIDARVPDELGFGFSKFVGYQNLDAETYLKNYKKLNGRKTERALSDFCEELRSGSPAYQRYHEMLTDWLAGFGKTPRKPVRLMLLNPEERKETEADDRRLLELIVAAADLLPVNQRHELRSRL